jgi:adenylyl-sulfate kinase
MRGFTVWFTGLSGAGKSTLSELLAKELEARGRNVEVLDGDEVRTHLSKGLSYTREDRDTNVARIAWVASLLTKHGAAVITAAISPYVDARAAARAKIGEFVEVYVRCSLEELARRDVKGLYARALRGEIPHFTGVNDPYEPPENPDVIVDSSMETKEESLARILAELENRGYIPKGVAPANGVSHAPTTTN